MKPLLLLLCSCAPDKDPSLEAKLRPIIAYVDAFVGEHHRLPAQAEFHPGDEQTRLAGFVLLDRSNAYAASKGARAENDYMVGVWNGDFFYYYKSWDHSFIPGADEDFLRHRLNFTFAVQHGSTFLVFCRHVFFGV